MPMPPLNLNVTQTPISGISGDLTATTGAFFSRDNAQPPGPHDLVSASVGTGDVGKLVLVAGIALLALVIYRKVK